MKILPTACKDSSTTEVPPTEHKLDEIVLTRLRSIHSTSKLAKPHPTNQEKEWVPQVFISFKNNSTRLGTIMLADWPEIRASKSITSDNWRRSTKEEIQCIWKLRETWREEAIYTPLEILRKWGILMYWEMETHLWFLEKYTKKKTWWLWWCDIIHLFSTFNFRLAYNTVLFSLQFYYFMNAEAQVGSAAFSPKLIELRQKLIQPSVLNFSEQPLSHIDS